MPPKNIPGTPTSITNGQLWRKVLMEAPVILEDWRCQVSMLVESDQRDTAYFEKFIHAAKDETRLVIKSITHEETVIMVKQIGSSKDIAPNEKVFEVANEYMRLGNPVPEDILALLIKFQILTFQTNDLNIKSAKNELDNGLKNESTMMMNMDDKNAKLMEADKKFHTELRMIGEEWKDKIYVEDFPKDGPDLYIAILGFRKCQLIQELIKIKIPLVAVVKVETVSDAETGDVLELGSITNSVSSAKSKYTAEIAMFWEDIELVKTIPETATAFKGIAFVYFVPPYKESKPDDKSDMATVYDEISYLLYDIQDLTRQHTHYIDEMKLIDIEDSNPNVVPENMKVYSNILDSTALECTTIAAILYAMVAQVESSTVINDPVILVENSDVFSIVEPDKAFEAQKKIDEIFKQKKMSDRICDSSELIEENTKVDIVPWGDRLRSDRLHCNAIVIDVQHFTLKLLTALPLPKLWEQRPLSLRNPELDFKLKLFHNCLKEHKFSMNTASRLLNLMCCKKLCDEKFFFDYQLYHKSLRKNKKPQRTTMSPIPSSTILKSYSFTYGENPNVNNIDCSIRSVHKFISNIECPKLAHTDDVIDILENQPKLFLTELKESTFDINDYDSFEELTSSSMLQALNKAYFQYNTSNIKYCPLTDTFIIVFFNKIVNGVNDYRWLRYIPSPVCLRDFFDYVFDEEYEWIVSEERIHDASEFNTATAETQIAEQLISKETLSVSYDKELIMKDSLKYTDMLNTSQDNINTLTGRESQFTNVLPSGIERRSLESSENISEKEPKFVGFNMGDDCIKTVGKSHSFFSTDGTAVHVETYNNFGDNFCTKIQLTTSNFDVFLHSAFDLQAKRIDNIQNIRLAFKCGMNLNFHKLTEKTEGSDEENSATHLREDEHQPFHKLQLSWPNGLFIEPIWAHFDNLPISIKQTYISEINKYPNISNELHRCYSAAGQVLIYKDNGDITICCSDGSIYIWKMPTDQDSTDARKVFKANVDEFLNADESGEESPNTQSEEEINSSTVADDGEYIFGNYDVTLADGKMFKIRHDSVVYEDKILLRTATDYLLGEVYSRRLDGTNTLLNKDGIQTTTFSDGTKISSYFVIEEQGFIPKVRNYATMLNFKQNKTEDDLTNENLIQTAKESFTEMIEYDSLTLLDDYQIVSLIYVMEHPDYATIISDTSSNYITINLSQNIVIKVEENGTYKIDLENTSSVAVNKDDMIIKDTKCVSCMAQSTSEINFSLSPEIDEVLLANYDCFKKLFTVNFFGDCFLADRQDGGECCENQCNNFYCCRSPHRNDRRFFVLKRDLTGEEYVHRQTVNRFKNNIVDVPWSNIKKGKDVYNSDITYETYIFPTPLNISQCWHMESLIIDTKPKKLKHNDLKRHGKKGIYPWMRPFPRKTFYYDKSDKRDKVTPKTMILRTLRKMVPNNWNITNNMEMVLEKYICLERNERKAADEEMIPMSDERAMSANELEKLGMEMYEEILTSFDKQCVLKSVRNSREMMVQLNIKKYLEQRTKDRLKEEFYREALRTKNVPKYEYPVLPSEDIDEINIIEQ